MPSYTRNKKREKLTFVKVSLTQALFYGFKTKDLASLSGVSADDLIALGHLDAAGLPATRITIIGANSPKPPRMRKIVNKTPGANVQASVSTYCAIDKIATAAAAEWQLVNAGRGVHVSNNARTVTVGAKIAGGGYYLFPMNAADAASYAETLGLELPTALSGVERAQAFSGTSYPKPAVIKIATAAGTFSSFCSHDAIDLALSVGYELVKAAKPHPVPAAAATP
jgi:hypothetical protein